MAIGAHELSLPRTELDDETEETNPDGYFGTFTADRVEEEQRPWWLRFQLMTEEETRERAEDESGAADWSTN